MLKLLEVEKGMSILGVSRGSFHWHKISVEPSLKKNCTVYHVIGARNEAFIPKDGEVITRRAVRKISEITASDLIEICPYLSHKMFQGLHDAFLNQDLAYLLGILVRRVSLSAGNKIAVKIVSSGTDLKQKVWKIKQILKKYFELKDFECYLENGPLYSFLIFKKTKELSKFVKDSKSLPGKVPLIIRRSKLEIMKAFLRGFVEVSMNTQLGYIRTSRQEDEIRRFTLNYLSLYQLPIIISVSLFNDPYYVDFFLTKKTAEFFGFINIKNFGNFRSRALSEKRMWNFRFPYSKVLSCYLEKGPVSYFPEETINWSPMVELIPMRTCSLPIDGVSQN